MVTSDMDEPASLPKIKALRVPRRGRRPRIGYLIRARRREPDEPMTEGKQERATEPEQRPPLEPEEQADGGSRSPSPDS